MLAVYSGSAKTREIPPDLVLDLGDLSKGAGHLFAHGEIAFDGNAPIRIDDFFAAQARRAVAVFEEPPDLHYEGVALSSFDGILKELDHLGRMVRGQLILTAGGKRLDCVFDSSDFPNLRESFDRRARVEGIAYYTGTDLPDRLQVKRITLLKEKADLVRWRGALKRKRKTGGDLF
jgi:hypothetical protein